MNSDMWQNTFPIQIPPRGWNRGVMVHDDHLVTSVTIRDVTNRESSAFFMRDSLLWST